MNNIKNNNNFLLFLIIFLTSFLLGVIVSFYIGKNINNELLISDKEVDIMSVLKNEKDLNLEKFWEVYKYIKNDYYENNGLKKEDLVDGAIKGMVASLGDKHSEFMTNDETKRFNEALSGDFEGIGAVVEKSLLGVKIERILKGSPAKKYGLLKDDIILEANGFILKELDLYDSVEKIKGKSGTLVKLKILREGEKEVLEKDIIRGKIKIPSIDFKLIENTDLGYIAINLFGDDTDKEFEKAILELKSSEGLIIDLRDNGGGYLQKAVSMLSLLIENNRNLVFTKYKKLFENEVYKSINNGNIYKGKIVVLINGNSASASEITAGALSDYNIAIVVGEKSYGKGSVQQPFDLNSGGLLKLTIANWYTPNDKNIDKEGIEPDIEVKFEKEDYENKYDRQLEVAKEVLKDFIKYGSTQLTIDKYNNNSK